MRKITLSAAFLFALALSTVFMYSSCKKDLCKDVICQNGGVCEDGTCSCATGYEGSDCSVESRTKFLNANNADASYRATENGSVSGGSAYDLTIKQSSSDITKVLIHNLWDNFTNNVIATVSGDKITFSRQEPDSDGYFVVGSGTISGTTVSVDYTVTKEAGGTVISTDHVTGTWVKQ